MTFVKLNMERRHSFENAYELEEVLVHPDKKLFLGNKTPRACRFCGKTTPEVNFRKKAHVIPQFFGNRNIMSYFECDSCNELFSKYESSLSGFVGPFRAIAQMKGQSGIPKYKNPQTNLQIYTKDSELQIEVHNDSTDYNLDHTSKTLALKLKKDGFIPIHAFRSLVKTALCLVPPNELNHFSNTFKFLQDSSKDLKFVNHPFLKIINCFIPGAPWGGTPVVCLFKKRIQKLTDSIPDRTFVLFFSNHIYQIFLPFNDNDFIWAQKPGTLKLPLHPIPLPEEYFKQHGAPVYRPYDVSSSIKINEPFDMVLGFDSAEIVK